MNVFSKVLIVVLGLLAGSAFAQNQMYAVVNNHLGAPEMLIDNNQHVVWQAEYDEFGKATLTVQEVEFNQRLPGQYYDKETGLHYNYYRDYNPALGRYVQSDPIGLRGGINTYGYVYGNPLSFIDPLGLMGINDWWLPKGWCYKMQENGTQSWYPCDQPQPADSSNDVAKTCPVNDTPVSDSSSDSSASLPISDSSNTGQASASSSSIGSVGSIGGNSSSVKPCLKSGANFVKDQARDKVITALGSSFMTRQWQATWAVYDAMGDVIDVRELYDVCTH